MMYVSEKIVSICRIIMRWLMSLLRKCSHVKTNKCDKTNNMEENSIVSDNGGSDAAKDDR